MTLALAGDTMLGRGVGQRLGRVGPDELFSPDVVAVAGEADLFVLNLECAVSDRGSPWPNPAKPFFFRGPPAVIDVLVHLGVDCVTLANNHALDFGYEALLDTRERLISSGISVVGAGADIEQARAPQMLDAEGFRVGVIGVTDHPAEYAAEVDRPGVAYANLSAGLPDWLRSAVASLGADAVLVTPHWGPNMVPEPLHYVRAAAAALRQAGATLVAGHSAHVFHGMHDGVLFDLGDFIDDYATGSLRNDLGLLFLVTLDRSGLRRVEAVPLALDFCYTRLARGDEADWVQRHFQAACAALGTEATVEDGRLVIECDPGAHTVDSPAETLPRGPRDTNSGDDRAPGGAPQAEFRCYAELSDFLPVLP